MACGDDDNTSSTEDYGYYDEAGNLIEQDPYAGSKCETFVEAMCTRVDECGLVYPGDGTCEENASADIPCTQAYAVRDTYDDCLSDVKVWSCTAIPEGDLPSTCEGVIYSAEE